MSARCLINGRRAAGLNVDLEEVLVMSHIDNQRAARNCDGLFHNLSQHLPEARRVSDVGGGQILRGTRDAPGPPLIASISALFRKRIQPIVMRRDGGWEMGDRG